MPHAAGAGSPRHKHREATPERRNPLRGRPWLIIPVIVLLLGGAVLVKGLAGSNSAPVSDHAPRPETGVPNLTDTVSGNPSPTSTAAAIGPVPSPSPVQIGPAPSKAPSPRTSPKTKPKPSPSPTHSPASPPAQPAGSSGDAMPTGNLPGWTEVFTDDFNGSSLNRGSWGPYSGMPGGDPGGWWDPSHAVVGNGMLQLRSYRDAAHANPTNPGGYVSGGVSSAHALRQTYGKYLVRFRMDKGEGIAGIMLLWPSNDVWPPEIDFGEDGGGSRDHSTVTLHYGSADNQIARTVSGDFSQWHTLGVEWTPGQLVFTMDGRDWATIASSGVPSQAMEMDLQTQAGTCGNADDPCPNASTPNEVDMDVDWVAAYAYTPGSA